MLSRIALAALVVLAAAPTVARAEEPDPLRTTIERTRNLGVALYGWLAAHPPASGAHEQPESFAWSDCPRIDYQEAKRLLVPEYAADLPQADGWGHQFELCLRRQGSGLSIGVRSPGRDGRYDGDTYLVGRFEPGDLDRDVVWIDGYFVRWPERK
jgi:hypothetical protein